MCSVLGRLTSQLPRFQRKAHLYLGPLIEERKALKDHGLNWDKSVRALFPLVCDPFCSHFEARPVIVVNGRGFPGGV